MKPQHHSKSNAQHNQFLVSHPTQTPSIPPTHPLFYEFMIMFRHMVTDPSSFMRLITQSQNLEQSKQPSNWQNQVNHENHRKRQFQIEQYKYRNYQVSPRKLGEISYAPQFYSKQSAKKGNMDKVQSLLNQSDPQNKPTTQTNAFETNSKSLTLPSSEIPEKNQGQLYQQSSQHQTNELKRTRDNAHLKSVEDPRKCNNFLESDHHFSQNIPDISKYYQAQERPIKGIDGGDFNQYIQNQYLEKQQGINLANTQVEEVGQQKKTKEFLKKGSRQHLSNAHCHNKSTHKTKSKNQYQSNQTQNRLSISPNRVLGDFKKRNQLTPTKPHNTKKQNSKNPKPINKSPRLKKIQKPSSTAIKRGFEDQHHSKNIQISPQIQALQGVNLTQKQLHQIIRKYNQQQKELKELKNKYLELCNILASERIEFERQMTKQREEFQMHKQKQESNFCDHTVQQNNLRSAQRIMKQQKQQIQNLKQQIDHNRKEYQKQEQTNLAIIQQYKQQLSSAKITIATLEERFSASSKLNVSYHKNQLSDGKSGGKSKKVGIKKEQVIFNNKDFSLQNQNTNIGQSKQHKGKFNGCNKQKRQQMPSQSKNLKQFTPGQQCTHQNRSTSQIQLEDLAKNPLSIDILTNQIINSLFRSDRHQRFIEYQSTIAKKRSLLHSSRDSIEGKVTNIYADGGKEVIFDNGIKKQQFPNGYTIVKFKNGDIKQKLSDGTVLYLYKEKEVDEITLTNGINIYRFENNQVEFHFPDQSVQIRYPDGTFKFL